ncbi:sensor histidine kinase [Maricaulis sp.]|uniref:sensor histidine kinase n=1 Tax=Maricaulis sp. TaxID=1486257 RepID=UPI003A8D126D
MNDPAPPIPDAKRDPLNRLGGAVAVLCRGLTESLPGQLLMLTVGLIAIGVVLVYFPASASYRLQWMVGRAEAAHLAALAADVAPGGALGEDEVGALLAGADAVAVSRVRNGMNELVLYAGPIDGPLVESDVRTTGWVGHVRDTVGTLTAGPGRFVRIRATPMGRRDEVIDVIVPEAPLKAGLADFSRRYLAYSVLIALGVGVIIYLSLFYLFVRPMRRLATAMIRFRYAPHDPARTIRPGGARNEIGQAETELARMQTEIRQALHQRERLAALGEAVATINHDLRNVLASAQLVSDRLATDSDERVRGMGQRLVRAVDRGVRLCEATLEFGRAEESPPVRQRVILADLLEEAADDALLVEGGTGIDWRNQAGPDQTIHADPDHGHRIFLNLFRNAIQAMAGSDAPAVLEVSASAETGFCRIDVRDTGPGLPSRARDKLFRPFAGSTKRGGTGLGLSIARELARAHGGDIELVSTGPEGTVFAVRLPV